MEIQTAMRRAVALSLPGRARSAPNPSVGCVLVREGLVVGEGATEPPGGRHAEIVALGEAGAAARGATAVVTLEPCVHQGRTGPCADALIAAGVAEVVVAIEDPDSRVAGGGLAALRAAGIPVRVGVEADAARDALRAYLKQRSTGRPWVVWKTAMSLDGRVAARDGGSQWITGEAARGDAHRLRSESQAILVGAGTARTDAPRLTVRGVPEHDGRQPVRVLVDGSGATPADGPLFDVSLAPTIVYTGLDVDGSAWNAAGADVVVVPADDQGVALDAVLDDLGARGVLQCLVEGGAHIAGSMLRGDLVDEIVAYVAPHLLGADALPAAVWSGPDTLAHAPAWNLTDVTRVGPDVRLTYRQGA